MNSKKLLLGTVLVVVQFFMAYMESYSNHHSNCYFIENKGQWDSSIKFTASLNGINLCITQDGLVFDILKPERGKMFFNQSSSQNAENDGIKNSNYLQHNVSKLTFNNSNYAIGNVSIIGSGKVKYYENYFNVGNFKKTYSFVPAFKEILIENCYDQVNMRLNIENNRLIVYMMGNPQNIPESIEIKILADTVDSISLLTLDATLFQLNLSSIKSLGILSNNSFEIVDNTRSEYITNNVKIKKFNTDYSIQSANKLSFSTFIGGSQAEDIRAICIDKNGRIIVSGTTSSHDFPITPGCYKDSLDYVFLSALSPDGSELIYSTFGLYGAKIATDKDNFIYLLGYGNSNSVITDHAYQRILKGGSDLIVTKIDPSGSDIIFSTFLGGSKDYSGLGFSIDDEGNSYICGNTTSPDYPTTKDCIMESFEDTATNWRSNIFITKLNKDGSDLIYSTYLGGLSKDKVYSFIVDDKNCAYLTGLTDSKDFPLTANSLSYTTQPDRNGFVTKISAVGKHLEYSTLLPAPRNWPFPRAIAVDAQGQAVVAGDVSMKDYIFTEKPCLQGNVFLMKLNQSGDSLIFALLIGNDGRGLISSGRMDYDCPGNIAIDKSGYIYLAGNMSIVPSVPSIITVDAYQKECNGGESGDVYIAKLRGDGKKLLYCSYIGGSDDEYPYGINVDNSGGVYITGQAGVDFPTSDNAFQKNPKGYNDGFVVKFQLDEPDDIKSDRLTFDISLVPNPVRNNVNLDFSVSKYCPVSISISNSLGMKVAWVVNQKYYSDGSYREAFDTSDLPSGIYFCTLQTPECTITKQFVVVK